MLNWYKRIIIPVVNAAGERRLRRFSNEPVVIGGAGRSGTTLLLAMLDAHPHLYCFSEQIGMFKEWDTVRTNGTVREVPTRIDRLHRWLLTHRIPREATRWCEKTPHNIRYFRQIIAYLSGRVRLIHLVRDGRDVITSRHPYRPDRYWVPVSRWVNDVSAGLEFVDNPLVLTIRYEDLVADYENAIAKVCAHIGEECVPQVRDWYANTTLRKSRHWFAPVQRLHGDSIGRWRDPAHRERVNELMAEPRAVELLTRFGYLDESS
ncbi:MAG: hypothetical protein GF331_26550 [Chitinivibrionales bacterium]|nr:hypothetical protein [Chitinivibrionales bacterium]